LNALHKACPIKMQKILTDNGKEFTDRLFASRERQATGNHEFDQLCQALNIEHRLTKPRTPRTNGMVERFNGRIADVLKTHRFTSGEDLEQTLMRYVALYNHQLPQSALKSKTPMRAMKNWYASHPHLFIKRPYDHPGCDSYDMFLKRLFSKHRDAQRGLILLDKSSTENRIQTLAREFKYEGHSWGRTKNYAEVPVFLDSKASRLIQLADLVAFALFRFHEYNDNSFYDVIKHCFDSEGGVEHGLYVRV